jgi:hypothetical protein
MLTVLTGWLERREREVLAYLIEDSPRHGTIRVTPQNLISVARTLPAP